MTKEELEHNHIKEIAENYVNECWGSYLDLSEVDLVQAGIGVAKIISKEKEKRITELETQIEKMKCCENCAFFKDKTYDICHRIKKLGTRKCAFYKMM